MEIEITDDARALLERKGGTMSMRLHPAHRLRQGR